MCNNTSPFKNFRQSMQGFTLIEAMVSVAILAVLAALAAPAFQTFTERLKVATVVDEMQAALTLTRGTAIQNNGNVTLRKLSDAEAGLTGVCGTTQNWSCGWRIFRDINGNGVLDDDGDGVLEPGEDEVIYTFNITNQVTVMRSVNGERMTANRWGQLAGIGAVGFAISPRGNSALAASTMVCLNSGGRVRIVERSVVCPP